MAASYRKDRAVCFGLCAAPPNLSKDAFQVKVKAMVDVILALPVVQKNGLTIDIIFQNELLDERLEALGLPIAPPSVWLKGECETGAQYEELLEDQDLAKLIREAEEFGFRTGTSAFFADVVTKVDIAGATSQNCTHVVAAVKVPAHLSSTEFQQKLENIVDKFLALPITQQKIVKFSTYVPNENMNTHLRALGFPEPEPVAVVMYDVETQESMIEIATHPSIKTFAAETIPELSIDTGSSIFSADVVTTPTRS
ncbi:hypothetical protein MVEN_01834200 [Mycena venus]|uniref:Uncharacterized protein n=1 Tax=Mycena venus TaxID=2733690 RepID=A0A8H6XJ28_9AGAR|nr:hypothetical protein MVEN_01834200 [Mycena venus]